MLLNIQQIKNFAQWTITKNILRTDANQKQKFLTFFAAIVCKQQLQFIKIGMVEG